MSATKLKRRRSMCSGCPFQNEPQSDEAMRKLAQVEFTCHEEDGYVGFGESGIQCRGHWEAVRKFNRRTK